MLQQITSSDNRLDVDKRTGEDRTTFLQLLRKIIIGNRFIEFENRQNIQVVLQSFRFFFICFAKSALHLGMFWWLKGQSKFNKFKFSQSAFLRS